MGCLKLSNISTEAKKLDPNFSDTRLIPVGKGESDPLCPNDTDGLGNDANEQNTNRRTLFLFKNNSTTSGQ